MGWIVVISAYPLGRGFIYQQGYTCNLAVLTVRPTRVKNGRLQV